MNNLNTNNVQLGYYLAGLIEGDGSIWTSKTLKSSNGRAYNPHITFAFHEREMRFYMHLKCVLNTGGISKVKVNNTYVYTISEKNKIIEIIRLINGKFRTPKIERLHKAIDRLNLLYKANIEKLPLDISSLNSNPWLAGFTDADGNFYIYLGGIYGLNNTITRGRVVCSFSINQRLIDKLSGKRCLSFMTEIAELFKCNIRYKGRNEIRFVAQANNKHYLVKSYFNTYPLMTSKYLNYLCFLEGLNYLGKRLTIKEIMGIRDIKNSMNNKRTYYNWDHLKNFYK